jgi:hypothetical protein
MLWRARGAEPGLKWEAWPLSRVEMTRACIGELNNGLTHLIMTKLGTQNEPLRGGIFIADTAGLFCYSCRLCLLGAPGRSCTTTHLEVRPELALYSMVRANCRLLGDSAVTVYTTSTYTVPYKYVRAGRRPTIFGLRGFTATWAGKVLRLTGPAPSLPPKVRWKRFWNPTLAPRDRGRERNPIGASEPHRR